MGKTNIRNREATAKKNSKFKIQSVSGLKQRDLGDGDQKTRVPGLDDSSPLTTGPAWASAFTSQLWAKGSGLKGPTLKFIPAQRIQKRCQHSLGLS